MAAFGYLVIAGDLYVKTATALFTFFIGAIVRSGLDTAVVRAIEATVHCPYCGQRVQVFEYDTRGLLLRSEEIENDGPPTVGARKGGRCEACGGAGTESDPLPHRPSPCPRERLSDTTQH